MAVDLILIYVTKIIHDRKKCTGCGSCAAVCPSLFEMSEDQTVADLKGAKEKDGVFELETESPENAKDAADLCGVGVIKVV